MNNEIIGRPLLLTPEMTKKVDQSLRQGLSITGVCRYIGIDRNTWYLWKLKAEREKIEPYVSFFKMVEEALGFCELKLLVEIQKDTSWQSKYALLKSRFRDDWAEKNAQEIQAEIREKLKGSPVIDINLLTQDEQEIFLKLTEKALRKTIEIENAG